VQPLFAELEVGGIAIAHNGNFTNGLTLRRQLIASGAICQSTSDTEVVLHLIARSKNPSSSDRFIDAIRQMEGGYSILALTRTKLIAARDPIGIRPLVMGELDGKPIFCVRDLRARHHRREIRPRRRERRGGHLRDPARRLDHHRRPQAVPAQPERLCLFEYVYFARPDSVVGGRSVYVARKNMGINLAKEAPVEGDVVVPVPDGGTPAAIGYAQQSGIPFELRHHPQPLCRPHLHRADPVDPRLRRQAQAFANRAMIAGKRVVLVDDSIVRGTTSVKIVQMIRDAGAREVHIRVASPMIFHSGLLRHRHARSGQAARQPVCRCRRHVPLYRLRTRSPSCRSTGSTDAVGGEEAQHRAAAIHRPLFHRRLSDPAARQGRRGDGQQALHDGEPRLRRLPGEGRRPSPALIAGEP
jgi:amidophosphoribosyltransferase